MISFISSFEIINVVVADTGAANPNGIKMLLANGLSRFFIKSKLVFSNGPKSLSRNPNRKPCKIWIVKGSEFYNRSMKSWLEKNAIELHSKHNKGKSVVTEPLNLKE